MFFIDTLVRQWLNGKPFDFTPYVNGEVLDMSNVEMPELPYNLYTLKNIKEANFSYMGLKTVKQINTLRRLEKLDLSHNQLSDLSGLDNRQLTELNASYNRITTLKGFSCKSIQKLFLQSNCFTAVDELKEFRQLQELDISWNRGIQQLNWLGHNTLTELRKLNCSSTFIGRIGFNSGKVNLPALRELDMSQINLANQLLKKIEAKNLEKLILILKPDAEVLKNFPKASVILVKDSWFDF